jgi:hypothetical protein
MSPAAWASTLSAWKFDSATQQLTVTLPDGVTPQYTVAVDTNQIVLDIPQAQLGDVPTEATYDGSVRQITLTQLNADTVRIVLDIDPAAELVPEQVQLVAIAAGEQTQWILTPLAAQSGSDGSASEATTRQGMIVELPALPADPNLSWPYTGLGRLSISASNLMLPSNLDTFNTLPETLAIDPFNLGLPEVEQVAVPSLEELDAAVGVAIAPASSPSSPILAQEPPTEAGTVAAPSVSTVAAEPAASLPAIDQDNGGLAIPVLPAAETATTIATAGVEELPAPSMPAPSQPGSTISQQPGPITEPPPVTASVPAATSSPTTASTANPSATVEPPFLAAEPPTNAPIASAQQAAPAAPTTVSTGGVEPPQVARQTDPVLMAAEEAIAFGQPLPASVKAVETSPSEAGDRPLSPDILISSGTILELRYTGTEPLRLDPNTDLNEVLVLETEIRDPVTNGVLAPAGSQLIGQFETHRENQQWVSQALIVPDGYRIPFASTSEYLYGTPQISGGGLALGTGAGALALTLLTGFSGIGLLGGAILGATTAVGIAPQQIVIQPNEVIYAQVTEDIPRSMPIAAALTEAREWGTVPGSW